MIDIDKENLIALHQLPKHLPRRPNGKTLHLSAVYRWCTKGVRGQVLETVRIGGTTYSSTEALQRFADALTAIRANKNFVPCVSTKARHVQSQRAAKAVRQHKSLFEE